MGVDTKGFVATACKDVFFIVGRVEEALNALIRPHLPTPFWQAGRQPKKLEKAPKSKKFVSDDKDMPDYKLVQLQITPASGMVRFHFSYAGEHRTLWMFFDCDCDRVDFTPTSISMSLGCWGQSDLFIQTALKALSPLGDVYFDHNDCDDVDFAKLDLTPLTFITACQERVESPYASNLEKWKKLFDAGLLRKGSFEEVVGMSEAVYQDIIDSNFDETVAKMKALGAAPKENVEVLAA